MARRQIKNFVQIPEDQLDRKLEQKVEKFVRLEMYKGPMPTPEQIEKYEKLYSGAAKFFFKTVEKQVNHRIEMESHVIKSNSESEKRGSWFGFIIAMSAIAAGVLLSLLDKKSNFICSAISIQKEMNRKKTYLRKVIVVCRIF